MFIIQYIYIINILPFIIQLYLFDYGCSYILWKIYKNLSNTHTIYEKT